MTALRKRLSALEGATMHDLSPAVKIWLGQPLSAEDQQQLEKDMALARNPDEIDTNEWSAVMKEWLG